MKRQIFLLLTACILSSLAAIARDYSAAFSNADAEQSVSILRKATGLDFVYQKSLLADIRLKVNGEFKDVSLAELLDRTIVDQLNMSYKVTGNTVTINRPEKAAGRRTVTGTVLDQEGEPVIGASVVCKGMKTGVVTDAEGHFSMSVPAGTTDLTVTYIGMEPFETPVASNMNIVMKPEAASMLDEVLVVAFGEQKRSSFTGSAGVVKPEDITKISANSPIQALASKIAGVQLKTASGSPTATASIQIRGTGSLNASNDPLYIVDGSPMIGSSYLINSEDIESITVLKDAASNALYGARGANGVIMITTKKGKTGPARITFNAKLSAVERATKQYEKVTDPRAYYELLYQAHYNDRVRNHGESAADAHRFANEALGKSSNDGGLAYVTFTEPDGEYLIGTNGKMNPNATPGRVISHNGQEYTILADDWSDASFRTGLRQDYNVSIAGGANKMNYYLSLGYLNNEGIVKGNRYERYSFRLKSDYQFRSWLDASVNMSYTRARNNSASSSVFDQVDWYAPIYPLYLRDGQGNLMYDEHGVMYDYGQGKELGFSRPFSTGAAFIQENELNTRDRHREQLNLTGTLNITVPWVEGLKAQLKSGIVQNNTDYVFARQPYYGSDAENTPNGMVTQEMGKIYSYNHQQLITYIRRFGDHSVNMMVGHEYFHRSAVNLQGSKKNMFSFTGNQTLDGAITVIPTDLKGNTSGYNTEGFFTRGMYDYKNRYFFSASYRRDASSRFHPKHRWGNFYSVGGAWIMNKEEWFPKNPAINMLKIKASWGQQGNDGIGDYLYTTLYSIQNVNDNVGLIMSTTKGAEHITWENNSNFNAGVEFEFFNSRLSGEVEFFNRKTTDMLCRIRVPYDAGYSSQYANVGNMRNRGVEISLNYDLVRTRDFNLNVYANATHYKNRILKLADENKGATLDGHPGYVSGYYFMGEGLSIHSWRLPRFAGVDSSNGQSLFYVTDTVTGETTTTANYNLASYYYCGTSDPDVYGGFGFSASFKGFDLSAQFGYSIGGKAFDSGYQSLMSNPTNAYTHLAYHKDIYKAWSETNTGSNIPAFQFVGATTDYANSTSDRFLVNASSLSVQNLNLGYTFPSRLMKRAGIERLRLSASADNLWYWSKRRGFDPRNDFWGAPSTTGYSLTRTFTFGLEVGF